SSHISITNNSSPFEGGVSIFSSSDITFAGNNIHCGDCLGLYVQGSDHVTFSENNINGTDGGILVQSSTSTNLLDNQIEYVADGFGATSAITVSHSSDMIIAGNNVRKSYGGIFLNSTMSIRVFHNNFFGNSVQAIDTFSTNNVWDNGYPSGGNFWSNYNGTDPDRDGIGDTPYVFNNSQDRYPLMSPFTNGTGTNIPVVFVAAPSGNENSLTGTTVSTGSFTATAGDLIVVAAGTMHGPVIFASAMVTDTLGNTYSLAAKSSNVGIWTTKASSSGNDIIRFTNSGASTYYAISAAEYSGATVGTNTGTGSGTGNSLNVAVSGASSTSLVVGGFISWRTSSITMSSPDNQRQSDGYPNLNIIIGDVAASSSTTLTASLGSSSTDWYGIAVELRAQ
ncbi:MAG TPA: NosD domain-containing protein, partial [Candidatus Angelobacter sp.]|nr:NosD domain-containing protein [Candidatus Angelobacter sp.]